MTAQPYQPLPGAPASQRPLVRTVLAALLTAAIFLLAVAVTLPGPAAAASHTITIANLQFTPDTLAVAPGDTVTFVNRETDNTNHTIAGDWASPELRPGQSWSTTVGSAARYEYYCSQHPYMTGTVTTSGGGSSPSPTASPTPTTPSPSPSPTATTSPGPTASPSPSPTSSVPPYGDDQGDGTRLAVYEVVDGVKVFRLRMSEVDWEVEPGVVKRAYAFNGIVPGPTLSLQEGDRVRIVVQNDTPEPTAVHWHGMILPNDQDGVPGITQPHIEPGKSWTYEWTAVATGTHWYHSHMGGSQVGRGLYGALLVQPKLGGIAANRHYNVVLGDGSNGFTINGRSFPATVPLKARVGEKVHLRFIGTGPEQLHPMHLHGQPFQVVAQDGNPLLSPYLADTLTVAPGQTFDVVFTPREPGTWLLHCHVFSHSEGPHGMTGIATTVEVKP